MSEEEKGCLNLNIKIKCKLLKYMGEIQNYETGEIVQYYMKDDTPHILVKE